MDQQSAAERASRDSRTIEINLDIDATVKRVWKALTDPVDLARWFPLIAEVEPGAGGSIQLSWGPDMNGRNAILVWEPDRHLRTRWFEQIAQDRSGADLADDGSPRDPKAWSRLAVDFFLQEKGDRTVVRMVHSGFSNDPSWDKEYAAHSRGWAFELRSLVNYLENHQDRDRCVAWARRPIAIPKAEAWLRLAGRDGMLCDGLVEGLRPGDAYGITTADDDRFAGQVILNTPTTEFAASVTNLDHALLRFGIEDYGSGPEASIWLSIWGDPATAAPYQTRFTAMLARLFEP